MTWITNLPLLLYLVAIPLISMGTTAGQAGLTWIGFLCILCASLITPGLRLRENVREKSATTQFDHPDGDTK